MRLASWTINIVMAAVFTALFLSGCARRHKLTPDGLAWLERSAKDKDQIFVYPHKRVVAVYERLKEASVVVDRTVKQDSQTLKKIVPLERNEAGQIIDRSDRNGVPMLWISFNPKCNARDCAFGFVRTEDELYKLVETPTYEGFRLLGVYRKSETRRNRMKKRKVKAFGEANEVYTLKRGKRVPTVWLDIKKRINADEEREVERQGGR